MKYSLLLLLTTGIFWGCSEPNLPIDNSFTVEGSISGLDTDFMIRSYQDIDGNRRSDSIKVEKGFFKYSAQIKDPTFIFFWPQVERTIKRTGRGYYPAKSSQLAFLASPGDKIYFDGQVTDFIDAYPSGTKANDDLGQINRRIFPLMNDAVNLMVQIDSLTEEDADYQSIQKKIDLLNDQVINEKINFLAENPSSEAAAWYLSDMMLRKQIQDDRAVELFNNMDKALSNYPYYQEIKIRVNGITATQVGKSLAKFKTNSTMDGSLFEFKSLMGKYVLIDFWGTWCGPCVAEMPRLKEYGQKYADKLSILGVNNGDNIDKIESFTSKYGYHWKQILDGEGMERLALKFNISGYPTKFIVDPNGKILYRYSGSGEATFERLDELLNAE